MSQEDINETDRVDVYLHLDALTINVNVNVCINPPRPAVFARLVLGGSNMAGQITIDTVNESATVEFLDDHGDVTNAPNGAVVTFSSDNPAVLTIAPDPVVPYQGDVTPVAVGSANVGATIADANGNPILEPDGVTPFAVASALVTVSPGPAATAELVLSV